LLRACHDGAEMNRNLTLAETIEVARPLNEVFAYIADFSHIEEWDPAVARGSRVNDQPLGVGSEFLIELKLGIDLHYRVIDWVPDQLLRMTVTSVAFSALETLEFERIPGGTQVKYTAEFEFSMAAAAMAQAFPGIMAQVGARTAAGMKRALEDREKAPTASRSVAVADKLVLPGLARFTRFGYWQARRHWKPFSAFLRDKHMVITGATSGLGLATARALAARGAALTLVARDEAKVLQVALELKRATGNQQINVEIAELSLISEVEALAERLLARNRPIDALINNAGALIDPRKTTREGLEQSFALLLLSPYVLTERLFPLLKAAKGRVINVLSGGMYSQRVCVADLQSSKPPYSGAVSYARAKRGLMIMTELWAERWRSSGIVVNAMHPGWADTPGVVSSLPLFYRITQPFLRSPEQGADTIVWLAGATEAGQASGCFWLDREQHPTHVFAHTKESDEERTALANELKAYADRRHSNPATGPGDLLGSPASHLG
jgi:dehydrogenase/reductase SDR family protein 12